MCADFKDFHNTSSKDDFAFPYIDVLLDNIIGHAFLPFIDGYAGYIQVKMAEEDIENTLFISPWGTYFYVRMPVGLKNTGVMSKRITTTLLHDLKHKKVKAYVDDVIIKSKERVGHVPTL